MPLPATLLLIATLLPLASFIILMFMGKRLGTPLAGIVGTLFIAGSFVCSLVALILWLNFDPASTWGCGKGPIVLPMNWIPVGIWPTQSAGGKGFLEIGLFVDSLTVAMFGMITLVATLVHLFSIGYMREDKRFPRFFTYLGLFCFSMLGLVIGGTILQLFIFWELVGLCSYLLIGFWYEKKSASNAAIKAFVTNRVGDFGFLIGFGILFYHLGNVTLPDMWRYLQAAGTGHAIALPGNIVFSTSLLTCMGIGLFFGAVGKSAQFPLHVWLPDAMEGPTPVSALIHAATMVAAGVYLVARIFPVLTPDAKLFIAITGTVTLTMAALIALAQSDIKKVLAYSTLSQLGYMILAMGIGSWVGGLFHLITHAFFKALLFLGSGSVIHAAHHEQEMPQYGGLIRKIPVTGITFLIAVFAIAGTGFGEWGFSGFYSKDMILAHAGAFSILADKQGHSGYYQLFFILPTIIAYVTAFYMMRCWMLTFFGKPRNQKLYDHAHESPILWTPLVVLAVLAVISGRWMGIKEMLQASITENTAYCSRPGEKFTGFDSAWPADVPGQHRAEGREPADAAHGAAEASEGNFTESQKAHREGHEWVEKYVAWAFIVGMGLGLLIYMRGYSVVNMLMRFAPFRWIHTWLYRRMFFDELYHALLIVPIRGILATLSAVFDKYVIDGLVNLAAYTVRRIANLAGLSDRYVVDGAVNGAAEFAQGVGAAVRAPQSGRIRLYVTVLMIAVALGLAGAIVVVLST